MQAALPECLRHVVPSDRILVEEAESFRQSPHRFNVVPAGRRSGKTMHAKWRAFERALSIHHDDGRVIFAGPTHRQAKRIFWKPVKRMFRPFIAGRPLDGELSLTLVTGTTIEVMGMDVPERAEGAPVDHVVFDEYANMKPEVWTDHVRPMLAERGGTADFIGTPEGRNHYYELWVTAQDDDEWGSFTWSSRKVLPEPEIARIERDLDERTVQQEIDASFIDFEGRAYYAFDRETHVIDEAPYDPNGPIAFLLDFNSKPGNASVVQETDAGTVVIDEVFIRRYSNTPEVCRELLRKFGNHRGDVLLYGDPAGNQHKSSALHGTDWDLVRNELKPTFGDRLHWRVPRSPPPIRISIAAVNSRISSGAFRVAKKCEWMIRDLEGTEATEEGDIKKEQGSLLTHLTDGLRYYVQERFPVSSVIGVSTPIM